MAQQDAWHDIEVVQANLDDTEHATAVLRLLENFAGEGSSGGTGLDPEVRTRLIPALRAHPTTLIMLARKERQYLGTAICFVGFSTFAAKPLVNIHDLTVLAEHRGKGIGRSLLAAVEEKTLELGGCKVTLEVREDNLGARRLYGKAGYSSGQKSEVPVDYYFLEKHL